MIRSAAATSCFLGALLLLGSAAVHAEADTVPGNLPALNAAGDHASVVGVSSGGYMAAQLAVAWPERFSGVGVLAAGPWSCAQGELSLALNQCMSTRRGLPSLDELDRRRERYESLEQVGERDALSQLRAYVWHGAEDDTVSPELGSLLAEQWQRWLASSEQLRFVRSEHTGHGWPIKLPKQASASPQTLGDCRHGGDSHVLACDEDVADDLLSWLYPEREANASEGEVIAFDQSEFAVKGLADVGYLFIPEVCEAGGCPVTIALHGCQMSVDAIGDTFVRYSGLNRWAADHGQVVLYPQADSSMANPQGCWDWWGFAESTWQLNPLHDTRDGTQARALMAMLEHLQSTP
ncbi:PHB depolymerase family esterase [Vreelandella venusta]|uniref:PHB depolymerase family esterase n=1 Tax=Vreelandella venusta TaxID=44935 RepID=UPI002286B567|nr:PHB depolymerase family esterase [Halomonas venusta]WAM55501.1 poly(3-hydroxybutyrate) depolymerase [Halomonas venusta]